jgi:serine/tyrosine/threonine adenylyltransferase
MKFSDLQLTNPYLNLEPVFYQKLEPTPLLDPFVISTSQDAAKLLGIDEDLDKDDKLLAIVNGSEKLKGSETFAMCYAGYQFGHFVPRLGDGRAINLGKINDQNLQLKGSGQTLYSRHGDGRAVLRSSIREYLMSEAMHGLGIKTSRALALIGSHTNVKREGIEQAAIVLRLSPTWIRFGTFEYFYALGDHEKIIELVHYVIDESFPNLKGSDDIYIKMFTQIVKNTAETLAKWHSVGFNHGVMNTDNMSIDGRTIDYGPFAFLDDYDYSYVCNHTDSEGRYAFGNQPKVARWNLTQLAKALSCVISHDDATDIVEMFDTYFEEHLVSIMYNKLGLLQKQKDAIEFLGWLLGALNHTPIDYTLFFRKLSIYDGNQNLLLNLTTEKAALKDWLDAYDERLKLESLSTAQRQTHMKSVNPKYILKNHILQQAIDAAQKEDYSLIEKLLKLAHDPYSEHIELEHLCDVTPVEVRNIKLSCSS